MKDVIFIFDIPKKENTIKVKVWRDLKKMNAKKVQHSVWKSDDLKGFIDIANFIKKSGGHAIILEEKLIF